MRARLAPLSLAVVVGAFACGPAPGAKGPQGAATNDGANDGGDGWPALRDATVERLLAIEPGWGRQLGLHSYDGKVPDLSEPALQARLAFYDRALHDLDALVAKKRSEDDALDLQILRARLRRRRFELVERDEAHTLPQFYEELFGLDDYIERAYAPIETRCARLVEHEEASLLQVAHVRENLRLPLSATVARVAGKNFLGYGEYLRGDVAKACGGAGADAQKARFSRSNEALAKAADALGTWLRDEVAPKGNDSHVLGEAKYRALLDVQEGLTTLPLAEFSKMAEDDLARNKSAYEALSKTAAPTRPAPKELLAEASKVMEQARAFLVEKKIVTIQGTDLARVKESPPFMRWNAAFLDASGPFDDYKDAFFYVTLPDPTWPAKEQAEYVPTRGILTATTVHEVWPGHFLQARWQALAPTRLQQMSWSYSFGEGWAHYAEQMMIDEGFAAGSPEARLGQLADALLRNCRFVVSIGVHTGGMTMEQAAGRFVDDCKQDAATAQQQAERATFDPGYFAYTLGKLQILALRAEAKQRLGAKFSLQQFHDALLGHGAPPVALIHDRVLRELGAM